jgi:hypothetical protein
MPQIVNPEIIKFTFYRVQIVIRCIWPTGVAEPRWLSRIPDPDFPHPGSRIQKQEQISIVVNYFIFEKVQKKMNYLKRILVLSTFLSKKLSLSSQKYWLGFRDPEKT